MVAGTDQESLFKEQHVFTVEELNRRVSDLLREQVGTVWVEGELSGIKYYRSGGWNRVYGTLKDEASEARIVVWEETLAGLRFQLEDGMKVVVEAEVTLYQKRGQYQLVLRQVRPEGVGALELAFQQLKERLEKEGLFDPARKRPLPAFPFHVGVVTSPQGAALRDFLQITARRNPAVRILVAPARVQGEGAAAEIAAGLEALARVAGLDCIVLTRGGGSLEDLWPFNEEVVARAVAASPIPTISAVGHEVDWTMSDLTADYRAPTPSAAAELVAWSAGEWRLRIQEDAARAGRATTRRLARTEEQVKWFQRAHGFQVMRERIREATQRLDEDLRRLPVGLRHRVTRAAIGLDESGRRLRAHGPEILGRRTRRLADLSRTMNALGPTAVLGRGYAIARDDRGAVLRTAADVSIGVDLKVYLGEGMLTTRVLKKGPGLEALREPTRDGGQEDR